MLQLVDAQNCKVVVTMEAAKSVAETRCARPRQNQAGSYYARVVSQGGVTSSRSCSWLLVVVVQC